MSNFCLPQVVIDDGCSVVVEVEAGGPPGPQGPGATIVVGNTSTLAPNSPATVVNTGTNTDAILDFGIPQGIQGPIGPPGPGGVNAVYGSFVDLGDYQATSTTTAYPVHLGTTLEAFGMSVVNDLFSNPTIIQLQLDGTYDLQYSIQFTNTNSNAHLASVWLRVDGLDIVDSRSQFSIPGKHGSDNGSLVAVTNYLSTYVGTEEIQLIWQAESSSISIETIPAGTTPTSPVSPGVIVTVARIAQQGVQGPAATIAVGTTTTLPPNSSATVANSGTSGAAIFDFGIPEGEAATIAVGATTTLSPGSPATVSNSGTSSNAVFDFGIPEGEAATIAVGTTSTLSPGSPATVTNSGDSFNAIFDFGIPEGEAATIAVGTTTTVSPSTPASVTNSGTPAAAIFDFDIPQGETGFIAQDNPPTNTGLLWLDTDDPALASLAVDVRSDFVAPYSYIGVAVAGSATSSPVWRVSRINIGPPVVQQLADPIEWDDRLTAIYT